MDTYKQFQHLLTSNPSFASHFEEIMATNQQRTDFNIGETRGQGALTLDEYCASSSPKQSNYSYNESTLYTINSRYIELIIYFFTFSFYCKARGIF